LEPVATQFFLAAWDCAAVHFGRRRPRGGMRWDAFTKPAIAIVDDARRARFSKHFVRRVEDSYLCG